MDERLMKIARHYGPDSQLGMLQEECAELIQAVSKYKRAVAKAGDVSKAVEGRAAIFEEIADVEIMIEQILYLLFENDSDALSVMIDTKIRRQLNRIGGRE